MFMMTFIGNQWKLKNIQVDGKIYSLKFNENQKIQKKYIVGNIYRLPNELVSDITTFNEEFAETLDILHTKRTPTYLCGDFNIDLLKIHQKPNYCTFYDNLISSGYLPRISLPTRLTEHSATLIDNIFSTVLDDHKSGVIVIKHYIRSSNDIYV